MSFAEILRRRAGETPDDLAFAFLEDGVHETARLTYAQLQARAEEIGAVLEPGSRVLLLLPPGLDYIAAIFACFAADAIAVSAAPPSATQLDRALPRLEAIVADADATTILTDTVVRSVAEPLFRREVTWLAVDALPEPQERKPYEPGELAFLQYTSGSTGQPKGVMLSHANLLANCEAIAAAFGTTRDSVLYSWLPPYHDMGLIGGILHPVLVGAPCHVTSPITIIRRPLRWLEAVSKLKVTFSGGPNFMYDLCVKRARNLEGLDLSSWRVAVNGAEPVRAATLASFQETFGPYGFRKDALTAAYGLAESTLLLTAATEPTVTSFDREGLLEGKAILGEGSDLVGCGWTDQAHQIRIVDPDTAESCEDGIVGEVWAAGPSIAAGYWRNPEATEEVFGGGWMRTGDLGFVHAGQLYIAGRRKEVLIVNGVNHHPHDLEALAEEGEPLLRPHCSAAFESDSGVVLVAELARDHAGADLSRSSRGSEPGCRTEQESGSGSCSSRRDPSPRRPAERSSGCSYDSACWPENSRSSPRRAHDCTGPLGSNKHRCGACEKDGALVTVVAKLAPGLAAEATPEVLIGADHAEPLAASLSALPVKRALFAVDSYFRDGWDDLLEVVPEPSALLHTHATLLLKPDAVAGRRLEAALDWLLEQGALVVAAERIRLDRHTTRAMWWYQWNVATRERRELADALVTAGESLLLVARLPDAPTPATLRLSNLKGPADPAKREPWQLRQRLDNDNFLINFVHTADEPADLVREFGILLDGPDRRRLSRRTPGGRGPGAEGARDHQGPLQPAGRPRPVLRRRPGTAAAGRRPTDRGTRSSSARP